MINETQRELLKAVEELWNLFPEYRFSQMVSNYALLARTGKVDDIYDCEDDELLEFIRRSVHSRRAALAACQPHSSGAA